jgi:hypothetical protein
VYKQPSTFTDFRLSQWLITDVNCPWVVHNAADISETHQPTHFNPEDEDRMYLQNAGNTAYNHTMCQPRNRINKNPVWLSMHIKAQC